MVKDIAAELFPPGLPRLVRWRLAMFASLMFIYGVLFWMHATHAKAADVSEIAKSVSEIKATLLSKEIVDARIRQCAAINAGDTRGSARFWQERLQDLTDQYFKVTKREYPVPSCSELG